MIEAPLQRRAPLPPQLTRRVGVLGVLALVLFGIIAFRLWYLQVLTGTQNAARATANVTRDIAIAPPRGNILDSQGNLLATYRIAPEVAIVADDLPPAGPQRRVLYRRLARVLGIGWQTVKATADNKAVAPPRYAPTAIKDDVTTYALDYIAERKQLFPGVVERQVLPARVPPGRHRLRRLRPGRPDHRAVADVARRAGHNAVQGDRGGHDRRPVRPRGRVSALPAGHPGRGPGGGRRRRIPDRRAAGSDAAGARRPAEHLDRPRARTRGLHRAAQGRGVGADKP